MNTTFTEFLRNHRHASLGSPAHLKSLLNRWPIGSKQKLPCFPDRPWSPPAQRCRMNPPSTPTSLRRPRGGLGHTYVASAPGISPTEKFHGRNLRRSGCILHPSANRRDHGPSRARGWRVSTLRGIPPLRRAHAPARQRGPRRSHPNRPSRPVTLWRDPPSPDDDLPKLSGPTIALPRPYKL